MNDKEIRALSDEALESKIEELEPATKKRTPDGYLAPEVGPALSELLPYVQEQERRREAAKLSKTLLALAEIDKAQTEERTRWQRLIARFGNPLNF